jgi:hypothetical protein
VVVLGASSGAVVVLTWWGGSIDNGQQGINVTGPVTDLAIVGNYIGFRPSGATCRNTKEGISLYGVERALILLATISGYNTTCLLVQNGGYHNITALTCGDGNSGTADGVVLRNAPNTTVAASGISGVGVGIVLVNSTGASIGTTTLTIPFPLRDRPFAEE